MAHEGERATESETGKTTCKKPFQAITEKPDLLSITVYRLVTLVRSLKSLPFGFL